MALTLELIFRVFWYRVGGQMVFPRTIAPLVLVYVFSIVIAALGHAASKSWFP